MKLDPKGLEAAMKVPFIKLPDDLREPLHSLQADLDWLFARVAADGSVASIMRDSVSNRLSQIETAFYRLANSATAPSDGKAIEQPTLLRKPVKLEPAGICIEIALREAERYMAYYAGESLSFVGSGMPSGCLETIRNALDYLGVAPHIPSDGKAAAAESGDGEKIIATGGEKL